MTQFDLNGNEHKIEISGTPVNGRPLDTSKASKPQAKAPVQKSAPAGKPQDGPKASKAPNTHEPAKAPGKPSQPPAQAKEKAPAAPKSGKVETSLTPAEKAKRQKVLEGITADIRKESSSIASAYMRIGFRLWQVKESKLFLAVDVDGRPLKNVYDYSEMAFGFKKSSSANFISVCERFSLKNAIGNPTDKIDPAFALFGYAQLSVMLPLSDKDMENVKPEMSSREIKSLKSVQALGQSEESENTDTAAEVKKSVCYCGMCDTDTWDRLLKALNEKCMGHKIQIIVEK